jgi:hypothetical protein
MSTSSQAKRRALNLAVGAVAISLPVIGFTSSPAYADLANGYTSETPPGGNWPGTPVYMSTVPGNVATSQGTLTAAGTATYTVLAETLTPTSTFTLGRIDIIASGGADQPLILNVFALDSTSLASSQSPGFASSGSASYTLVNDGPTDLLGNGKGEAFNFYGFGDTEDVGFSLTDGPNANDQITLNAGTTYAVEIWEPATATQTIASTSQLYWWRVTGPSLLNDGQGFSSDDSNLSVSRNTLTANGQAGAAPRTFAIALYQPYDWNLPSGGDWNTTSNWLNGIVPTGIGMEADFLNAITAPATVTSTQGDTVGILNFNSPFPYTLADGGGNTSTLTLQAVSGTSAIIQVQQSTAEVDIPTILASNTSMKIAAGSSLTFGSALLAGSSTIIQTSGTTILNGGIGISENLNGTLVYGPLQSGGTQVVAQINAVGGVLKLGDNSGTAVIAGVNATGGALDITNNQVQVNYLLAAGANTVTDPVATIASELAAGFKAGWVPSPGTIGSSSVAAANASQSALIYSIGYADGADGITGVSSGVIEILPTLAGDAKLQGNVVFGDFQLLSQYFGQANTTWDEGDFTYNGTTNFGDFQLLSQNFGANASALTAGEIASLNGFAAQFGDQAVPNADGIGFSLVSVPEPASAGLLLAATAGLVGRRRKRK